MKEVVSRHSSLFVLFGHFNSAASNRELGTNAIVSYGSDAVDQFVRGMVSSQIHIRI